MKTTSPIPAATAATHTPRLVAVGNFVQSEGGGYLAAKCDSPERAKLYAAAPELLAQLVAMTDAYAKAMKDAGVTHYPEALHVVRQARAAIAKAEGRA